MQLLTYHSRKNTGGLDNNNDSSVLFSVLVTVTMNQQAQVQAPPKWDAIINTLVSFLLSCPVSVKVSAVQPVH